MQQQPYTQWSETLHRNAVSKRIPINGTLELTRRCNLACRHCYNNLPLHDQPARRNELSTAELRRVLDELADAGCLWLLLTGGEPFARSDILDIYSAARDKGFIITLFTNATLISEQIADTLAARPPFSIEVTLYGATEKTYERITGVPGSYERCLRGIRLLQSRGLPLKLKTVVLQSNRHELEAMQHLAENELGLEFKYDAGINPRLDFSLAPLAERLTPDEIVALDRCDSRRMQEWQSFADRFTGPAQAAGHENDLYHCGAGISEFAIDSDGRLSLCAFASEETWDLHTGSFREGWDSVIHAVRNKKISKQTKCTDCGLKAMCGMCPANAQLENGEPEQPVDFLCRVAHLRAEALGISVPEHGECEYCNHT